MRKEVAGQSPPERDDDCHRRSADRDFKLRRRHLATTGPETAAVRPCSRHQPSSADRNANNRKPSANQAKDRERQAAASVDRESSLVDHRKRSSCEDAIAKNPVSPPPAAVFLVTTPAPIVQR
nr:hypothetical protein Iba_chr15bCG10150 [Ipomoea batatas]